MPCSVLRADLPVGTEPRPRHGVPDDAFDSAAARSSAAGTIVRRRLGPHQQRRASVQQWTGLLGSQLTLSHSEPRLMRGTVAQA